MELRSFLSPLPLIAVLRGIATGEVDAIGDALFETGFRILEVPLNSPHPLGSIERLARRFGDRALVGAGTVTEPDQIDAVGGAGGQLIVMPHADLAVISAAKARGMSCIPGVATPTEAFAALGAGADGLKMFPAEMLAPAVLRAWRAVLPKGTLVFPVGGISPDNMAPYADAGASGFGTGSNLYRPGASVESVREVAGRFARAVVALRAAGKLAT